MSDLTAWSELLECRHLNQRNHQLSNSVARREGQFHEYRPWFDAIPPVFDLSACISSQATEIDNDDFAGKFQARDPLLRKFLPLSCPISADIRTFDFDSLSKVVPNFDVVLMDPPWAVGRSGFGPTAQGRLKFRSNKLHAHNGCSSPQYALNYHQLRDSEIEAIPMPIIQTDGLLFMWIVNNRLQKGIDIMCRCWRYQFITVIDWIKTHSSTAEVVAGNGHFLRHAKECILVGVKSKGESQSVFSNIYLHKDLFHAPRGLVSQKPSTLYEIIEELYLRCSVESQQSYKSGKFLEIFGRKNNLRDGWVTIGDEL